MPLSVDFQRVSTSFSLNRIFTYNTRTLNLISVNRRLSWILLPNLRADRSTLNFSILSSCICCSNVFYFSLQACLYCIKYQYTDNNWFGLSSQPRSLPFAKVINEVTVVDKVAQRITFACHLVSWGFQPFFLYTVVMP